MKTACGWVSSKALSATKAATLPKWTQRFCWTASTFPRAFMIVR